MWSTRLVSTPLAWSLCALLSGCATVHAASSPPVSVAPSPPVSDVPSPPPDDARLRAAEARNTRLEQRVAELAFAVDALRLATSRLRARVAELEARPPTVVASTAPPRVELRGPAPPVATPQRDIDPLADLLGTVALEDLVGPELPAGTGLETELRFEEARVAAGRGDCARAVPALAAFVREHPRDLRVPDAFLLSGACYAANGEYALAALQYRRVVDSFPGDARAATALGALVDAHRRLGEPDEARRSAEQLSTQYPNSREARSLAEVNRP